MTGTHTEKRIRAEATFKALQVGRLDLNNKKEAADTAKHLDVPEALVWLAVDGVDIKVIDQLVDWWPRKDGE